ncbi:unnamed protein product [Trichogramma brassicae]|uniref:CCHC-type domain-containing protein n=1 Tax=Trichogramma brassicae TaxID=86971 RepID=A0A6H5IWV8_9HYME|nr:unnamed protein product [Trichogramma brassicae]
MAQSRCHAVRPRPEAIVVKTTSEGGATYADILRKLYANPTLQDTVGKSVKCIRHSPSRALMMHINKGVENISALKSELEAALGNTASASTPRPTTAIEIKDLDESATKEGIREALCTQLGSSGLELDVVRFLRKAYAGTLTAVAALPDEVAAQAIKLGHIRIGWVSCRIRGRAEQLHCFRCLRPGHIAARCKGLNRTGLCYRCAKEGHQAKDCKALPTCVFCRGQGPDDHTSAQSLLKQTVLEQKFDLAIVSDQYRNLQPPYTWLADSNKQASIWVLRENQVQERPARASPFFT